MNFKITPPPHRRHIELDMPLSKSISNRALLINALTPGAGKPATLAQCDDTDAMISSLKSDSSDINIGAAGTAMRFLTAYFACLENRTVRIDGSERMRHRQIKPLVDALRSLGADIEYLGEEGYPPLKINGKTLSGGEVELAADISSQYISALMMIAPVMSDGLRIRMNGRPTSMPYIIMTMMMMMRSGISVFLSDNTITIEHGRYSNNPVYHEGDWSAASYWYELTAAGAVASVTAGNLVRSSFQGDSAVAEIFNNLGVDTSFDLSGNGLVMTERNHDTAFYECDLSGQPDLAQTVAVTCCICNKPFKLTGLGTLPHKETDRLAALHKELLKLGYETTVTDNNSISWHGKTVSPDHSPRIATYDDHRMAMSFAPAAMRFPGIVIEDAEVVSKSYPDFWNDLRKAGFKIEESA